MVKSEELKRLMRKKGTDSRRLSKKVGISESLFSQKLNNYSSFNLDQAQIIKEQLGMSVKNFIDIFFAE